jgi:cystathionine beta-lyase
MSHDFTSIMERHGKDSIAVDIPSSENGGRFHFQLKEGFDILPMWVADMNFPTCPSIQKAVIDRVNHPAFGYFDPSDAYFESILRWQSSRNHVDHLRPEDIGYENGVLGGVVSALNILCSRGGNVLLHSPTYIGFTHCMTANGYHMILSPLKKDAQGVWRMDYEDMDRRIKENHIHAAVFCSPHNPTGRVWEKEEIEKAFEVYRANDVYVISDEIWSDLILEGYHHIPAQSINEDARSRTIAFYAPSKTFNLAGLIGSYHIVYNRYLRERLDAEEVLCHYNSMNVLSMHALIGAYQPEGMEWLEELRQVLTKNVRFACGYIHDHFDGVEISEPQGTYMLFLDCTAWCAAHGMEMDELLRKGMEVGVIWQDGRPFHGEHSIRMNLALPYTRVQEAFRRLDQYVFNEKR